MHQRASKTMEQKPSNYNGSLSKHAQGSSQPRFPASKRSDDPLQSHAEKPHTNPPPASWGTNGFSSISEHVGEFWRSQVGIAGRLHILNTYLAASTEQSGMVAHCGVQPLNTASLKYPPPDTMVSTFQNGSRYQRSPTETYDSRKVESSCWCSQLYLQD
jgi:hypothetical protein